MPNVNKIWCGDHVACSIKHDVFEGRKIIGYVHEAWCENEHGKRTSTTWFEAFVRSDRKFRPLITVGLKRKGMADNFTPQQFSKENWGFIARFSGVDAAKPQIVQMSKRP